MSDKTKIFRMRMSESERQQLENAAANLGTTKSELIRDAIDCYVRTVINGVSDRIGERAQPLIKAAFPDGFNDADEFGDLLDRFSCGHSYQAMENLLLLDDESFGIIINAKINVHKMGAAKTA
jgi:predicted DNA-binding protein